MVSITGIMGVTLTGGQQYFMILAPVSLSSTSSTALDFNNQGVTSLLLQAQRRGRKLEQWRPLPRRASLTSLAGAAVPEPGSVLLMGTVLIGTPGRLPPQVKALGTTNPTEVRIGSFF